MLHPLKYGQFLPQINRIIAIREEEGEILGNNRNHRWFLFRLLRLHGMLTTAPEIPDDNTLGNQEMIREIEKMLDNFEEQITSGEEKSEESEENADDW